MKISGINTRATLKRGNESMVMAADIIDHSFENLGEVILMKDVI